jgi:integrase
MGLRIGEVCGLMGQDVEDGILTIRRTVQRIRDGKQTKIVITSPKTRNSHRQIPIPKQIADDLIAAPENYIISGCNAPLEPRVIEYRWKVYCNKTGLRKVNFHTLRHTFATAALEAGVDVKTLSEMLGHATVHTTMDLYCHPSMNHKAEAMKRIWE